MGFEPAWLRIAWQELGVKGAPETSDNPNIGVHQESICLAGVIGLQVHYLRLNLIADVGH
ncbi:hypothetical protein [Desulfobacca acetoxidans]